MKPSPSDKPDRVFDESRMVKSYTEWTVAETAADALGRMGAAAIPDLIESLHDQDPAVRLLAFSGAASSRAGAGSGREGTYRRKR